jgi:hypothetical protein
VKNKIDDLRNHLFATLEALQDPDAPMDIDRARAIADVAKVIVDSAKVEVEFTKATGYAMPSGFLPVIPQASTQSTPLALRRGAA